MKAWLAALALVATLLVTGCVGPGKQTPNGAPTTEAMCHVDSDCESWEYCDAGLCKTKPEKCSSSLDCENWQACDINHTCVTKEGHCASTEDCEERQTCDENHTCVFEAGYCVSNETCPENQTCNLTEHKCMKKTECTPGEIVYYNCSDGAKVRNSVCDEEGNWVYTIKPDNQCSVKSGAIAPCSYIFTTTKNYSELGYVWLYNKERNSIEGPEFSISNLSDGYFYTTTGYGGGFLNFLNYNYSLVIVNVTYDGTHMPDTAYMIENIIDYDPIVELYECRGPSTGHGYVYDKEELLSIVENNEFPYKCTKLK